MKKFIPLVVVGLLVLCGLQAVALPFNMAGTNVQKWKETPQETLCNVDELDQSQELYNFFGPVGSGPLWSFSNYILAQSFTPTKNLLTRIELYIGKNSTTTFDYTVAIRDDLNGSDLASVSLSAAEITTENFSWEEFDIPDLMVTPGDTYYIVSSTANVTENWYYWGLYMNGTVYPNGTIYYTINDEVNWTEEPGGDMSFKTYGTDATALGVEITGVIGVTVNTKNVGVIDATNVKTHVVITGGIFGLINISVDDNTSTLVPGDLSPFKIQPLGLGPITINVTARADNAAEVTKSVDALILLIFVIMK
jgi:hypothetical protein